MSLPSIQFKTTRTNVTENIKQVVEDKFQSLEKYIGSESDVKIAIEFEQVAPHNNGPIHRVEANFWLAGKLFRAEATEESFERAIDVVRAELDQELRTARTKKESMMRKGGRKIKEMMRFGK